MARGGGNKKRRGEEREEAEPPEPPPIHPLVVKPTVLKAENIAQFLRKINEPLRSTLAGSPLAMTFPDNWLWATLHARYSETVRQFARELKEQDPELYIAIEKADACLLCRDPNITANQI